MTWAEVCDDPSLRDLPFRIEISEWGNVEMSAVNSRDREHQAAIAHLLCVHKSDGVTSTNVGVDTTENTKVPDVIWSSLERRRTVPHEVSWSSAPEICVEVFSSGNMLEAQMHKGQLYLQAGAEEFWLCDERGQMQFFNAAGRLEQSRLCPGLPAVVEIPD